MGIRRIFLAAFCADAALYLVMLSLPFRALTQGAAAWQLGLIPALYAIPYSVAALVTGRRGTFARRSLVLRSGAAVALVAVLVLGQAQRLTLLLAWIPLLGAGLGTFWPTLHARVSEAGHDDLTRALGRYNMSWSAGKGVGFLAGGLLLARHGAGGITLVAALLLLVATWASQAAPPSAPSPHPQDETAQRRHARLRAAAWLVNGTTFALAATLNHHLPRLAVSMGITERSFGLFLGLVFLSQTATFWWLRHWLRWRGRASILVALPGALAVVALVAPSAHLGSLLALAPVIGGTMGLAYQASLYYSVRSAGTRGRDLGVHEAVLQTTATLVPLLGGVLVEPMGSGRAPFYLAAIACSVTTVVCGIVLWRRDRVAS